MWVILLLISKYIIQCLSQKTEMTSKPPGKVPLTGPDLTAVAESITAVASSLAPPEIIAEVAQKGLAEALVSNETLKERIKKVTVE